jgi:hypothetical protein
MRLTIGRNIGQTGCYSRQIHPPMRIFKFSKAG